MTRKALLLTLAFGLPQVFAQKPQVTPLYDRLFAGKWNAFAELWNELSQDFIAGKFPYAKLKELDKAYRLLQKEWGGQQC